MHQVESNVKLSNSNNILGCTRQLLRNIYTEVEMYARPPVSTSPVLNHVLGINLI